MTTRLREATDQDRSAVVALWHSGDLTRPWNNPESDFAAALGNPSSTVLVLTEGDRVLGTVMTGDDGHRGWLYYLAVHPGHQGEGTAVRWSPVPRTGSPTGAWSRCS